MLGTASNEPLEITAQVREGLSAAGFGAARPTPLSAYTNTAVARLPHLPSRSDLLAGFARHQDSAIKPTRKDLFTTVKLAVKAGIINPAQVKWLADNKEQPAHFYRAVQNLLADAFPPQTEMVKQQGVSLLSQWPLREITKFVAAWMRYDNDLVDHNLISLLSDAKASLQNRPGEIVVNADTLSETITGFVQNIVKKLNQFNAEAERQDFNPLCPARFLEVVSGEHVLAMEACDVIGVELPSAVSEGQEEYWTLLKLTLNLISSYLQPMAMPEDLEDMFGMRFEEEEHDVYTVDYYLQENKLEDTPENVEKALEACAKEISMAGSHEEIEGFRAQIDDTKTIVAEWRSPEVSIEKLAELIETLPTAQTQTETEIASLASDLLHILTNDICEGQFHELSCDLAFPFLHSVVFREIDYPVQEQAQMFFEHVMNGGCEEDGFNLFDWSVQPQALVEASKRLSFATQLMIRIVRLNDIE